MAHAPYSHDKIRFSDQGGGDARGLPRKEMLITSAKMVIFVGRIFGGGGYGQSTIGILPKNFYLGQKLEI